MLSRILAEQRYCRDQILERWPDGHGIEGAILGLADWVLEEIMELNEVQQLIKAYELAQAGTGTPQLALIECATCDRSFELPRDRYVICDHVLLRIAGSHTTHVQEDFTESIPILPSVLDDTVSDSSPTTADLADTSSSSDPFGGGESSGGGASDDW